MNEEQVKTLLLTLATAARELTEISAALHAVAMRHGEVSYCEKMWGPLPGSTGASKPAALTDQELERLRSILNG